MTIKWDDLSDAYGKAGELGVLVEHFLDTGDNNVSDRITLKLLHQGWRFEATPVVLNILYERCRDDKDFLEKSLELICSLAIGGMLDKFPIYDFYNLSSSAIKQAALRCEPPIIAAEINDISVNFAEWLAREITNVEKSENRIDGLQFLFCFLTNRIALIEIIILFAGSHELHERFSALCIESLLGNEIKINFAKGQICFTGKLARVSITLSQIVQMDTNILDGHWELALINGCNRSGDIYELDRIVENLDKTRINHYNMAKEKLKN